MRFTLLFIGALSGVFAVILASGVALPYACLIGLGFGVSVVSCGFVVGSMVGYGRYKLLRSEFDQSVSQAATERNMLHETARMYTVSAAAIASQSIVEKVRDAIRSGEGGSHVEDDGYWESMVSIELENAFTSLGILKKETSE